MAMQGVGALRREVELLVEELAALNQDELNDGQWQEVLGLIIELDEIVDAIEDELLG